MITDQDSRFTFWIVLSKLVAVPTFAESVSRLFRACYFPRTESRPRELLYDIAISLTFEECGCCKLPSTRMLVLQRPTCSIRTQLNEKDLC